jgi:glycine/D-amino acid oxidase-like deaminating enzyme
MGVEIPVESRKRCVFVFESKGRFDDCPLVIDPSGLYFRPEGRTFLAGGPPPDPDPDCDDFEVNWPQFEEELWPLLARRVPAFEALKLVRAWAGHYDLNIFDHNAIVGRLPGFENAYLAAGFSGHGIQQSPAIGRGLAELIAHAQYLTLDLTAFSYDRITAGKPLLERNVI